MPPKSTSLPEPATLQDAEQYVGKRFWKWFKEVRQYFEGEITAVRKDNLQDEDSGRWYNGWWCKVYYPADGATEDIDWPTMRGLLEKYKGYKRKSSDKQQDDGAEAAAAGAADEQQEPNSKRRRRSAQQRLKAEDEDMQDAEEADEAAASSDYEPDAAAAAASSGRKRGRLQQQQQQQERGSTGRKKQQPLRRRQQQRDDTTPDQDESSEPGDDPAAAAAADDDDEPAGEDREAAEEEDEEEEEMQTAEDLERMLQEQKNEVVTVRTKGLAGHLKSIQVVNFMCHSNFKMDFGTHVNVVSGSNGSGKSAVLQAMQCALGVRAKATGRGGKIAELVRQGCHEAKVSVTLWNTGEDAYLPGKYGDCITVEQTIKVNSTRDKATNNWRLLDCQGHRVSDRKDDLKAMLDHLSIDAANPLAVMTQDTSRNFLCGSIADKKKYDLFMEATMLSNMQENLRKAQGYVDEMKEAIKEIKEAHTQRKARVEELRQKLAKLEESAGLTDQLKMYWRATAWGTVEICLKGEESVKEALEVKAPEKRQKIQGWLDEAERALNLRREEEETLADQSANFQSTQENFMAEVRQLGEELKQARAEHRVKARTFRSAETKLNSLNAELQALMESTKESNNDHEREFAEKMAKYQQDVAQAQQEMQNAEAQHAALDVQHQQLLATKSAKEAEMRNMQQRVQSAQQTMQNINMQLNNLRQANGQKLALFGPHAQLRELVDRNRRAFDRVPIGPIGPHLTLQHTKWNRAAEVVLGGHLEKWIVHSARDLDSLKRLAAQLRMKEPSIIKADFDRPAYAIPANKQMPAGWQSLRQFIVVEHPQYAHIIDNKLMDQSRYESVVVDEDEYRCRDAVYNRALGPTVQNAVHVSGRQYIRTKAVVSTRNYHGDKQPRIGESFEATLRSMEQEVQLRQADVQQLHQQLTQLVAEVQHLSRQAEAAQKDGMRSKAQEMRSRHRLQALQTQAPVMEAGGADDDDDLMADQQNSLQEQIQQATIAYNKAKAELDQATLKQEQSKQLHESRQAELEEMLASMTTRQEAVQRVAEDKARLTEVHTTAVAKLQALERQIADLQQQQEQARKQTDDARAEALQHCTEEEGWQALQDARAAIRAWILDGFEKRIAAGKAQPLTPEEKEEHVEHIYQDMMNKQKLGMFSKRADQLDKLIQSVEADAGGNKAQLEHEKAKAEAEVNRHDRSVNNMVKVVHATSRAVVNRWQKYHELCEDVSTTVSNKFMAYMSRRGHLGKVRVDQQAGELRLLVKVNVQGQGAQASKSKPVKDLKQLSGGERSFTTVAFILALGEWTESPFRAMDEFDVFMDAINRRIATQTLLEFAREKGHLQFIFLTPQDLQAVEDAKRKLAEDKGKPLPEGFVKVVQMRPARPNQQQQQQQQR